MLPYILKLILCSALLYGYYLLAFRNRKHHSWNRWFLIVAVVASFVFPLIPVPGFNRPAAAAKEAALAFHIITAGSGEQEQIGNINAASGFDVNYQLFYLLICGIIFLFMGFPLLRLSRLASRARKIQLEHARLVPEATTGSPFSFFRLIFWNPAIALESEEGRRILHHELVHIRRLHSIDLILLNVAIVIAWVNPVFWLVRRELKIVHEFEADELSGVDGSTLSRMLLVTAFAGRPFHSFSHAFNASPVKRRIKMITSMYTRKTSRLARLAVLPLFLGLAFLFGFRPATPIPGLHHKPVTVVVDAGHGLKLGKHDGARSGELYEDDLTLIIARKIKERAAGTSINIVLTRTNENSLDLKDRVEKTKAAGADLFVSIHLNVALPDDSPKGGIEVTVPSKSGFEQQSQAFGLAVQKELTPVYNTRPSLVQKTTGIYVLDRNVCPAILLECGYVNNPVDMNFMQNEKNQDALADAILKGCDAYSATKNN